MAIRTSPLVGPVVGPKVGPNADVDESVPSDGPDSWKVPTTSAHFTKLGVAQPKYVHGYQEASGNILSLTGNALALVPGFSTTPPTYQQTVSGWTRKAVKLIDSDSGNGFKSANGTGPDQSTTSWASLVYCRINSVAATQRNICGNHGVAGGDTEAAIVTVAQSDGKLRARCSTGTVVGAYNETGGQDVAILMVYDRTASSYVVYTDKEQITGTFFSTLTNGGWGVGSDVDFIAGPTFAADMYVFYSCIWEGADAELTKAEVQTLFDAFNLARPWTCPFEGPNNYYFPETDEHTDFLAIDRAEALWGFQETSGNIADLTGSGLTLTATGLGYRQTITNYNRRAVVFTGGQADTASLAGGVGPNAASESVMWVGFWGSISTPAALRCLINAAGAAAGTDLQLQYTSTPRWGGEVMATAAAGGVAPVLPGIAILQYDRTNGVARVITPDEVINLTYNAGVVDGTKGFGQIIGTTPTAHLAWGGVWKGAAAELTRAQLKTFLEKLRYTVAWTP